MKKKKTNKQFFVISIIFLAVAVVFFTETNISIGKFILFVMCGFVAGVSFLRGLRKK